MWQFALIMWNCTYLIETLYFSIFAGNALKHQSVRFLELYKWKPFLRSLLWPVGLNGLNAKLTGRKNLGRKRCTSNRDDCKLENTVKQSWFKHLWELHKEWTEAGVSASRVTTLRRLQEKGYQATSEPETTSEASYPGCGEKELDCCSVVQSPLFRWK